MMGTGQTSETTAFITAALYRHMQSGGLITSDKDGSIRGQSIAHTHIWETQLFISEKWMEFYKGYLVMRTRLCMGDAE